MPLDRALRRPHRSAVPRALALAAALAAALIAFMGSGARLGPGPMERSSFRGGEGYWLLAKDGGVFAFGDAQFFGPNRNQGRDIAGMAATATGNGYWTVDDDGDVFAYGDAVDYGSRPGPEIDNIVGFAARSQGDGYWMVSEDGAVYAFGKAAYFGSANTLRLTRPIVGMAATPSGNGYWLIAGDGGVFSYGDAPFFGSTGAIRLNRSIIDFGPSPDGKGYRFIGSDGGVFTYGNAGFFGSTGSMRLNQPIVGFATTASGKGYWLVGRDGGVFSYGDAKFYGSTGSLTLNAEIVAIVATPRVKVLPIARDDAATVAEDGSVTIDVEANDTHALPAAVSIDSQPANGTATVSGGKAVYTPKANFNGSDSFKYKLTDTVGHSATATVTVTVTPVNDAPVAAAGSASTSEDTTLIGSVSATDVDGNALTYAKVSNPANGTVNVSANGTFSYAPNANFNGSDSFTFKANDGTVDSNTATVSITVNSVNDAPTITAVADQSIAEEGATGALAFTVGDVETAAASLTVTGSSSNTALVPNDNDNITIAAGSGGARTVTVTPVANGNGQATITLTVTDANAGTATETFLLLVTPVNDAPVATDATRSTEEDTALNGTVTASDVDPDTLTFSKVAGPSNGTATVNADGTFTYTPTANFNGSDSFTFKVNDGTVDSNTATVSITVNSVNDAPVASPGSGSTDEDAPLDDSLTASDVDLDTLTYAKVADPAHGSVTVNANGTFTYTPVANYNGPDSFTFKANDGQVDSNTETFSITVTAVNDAPVAVSDSATTPVGVPLVDQVTATDVENDPLTFSLDTGPSNGVLVFDTDDGTFTYTPGPLFHGTDSFTFLANDGSLDSNTATFTITVNSAPAASDDSGSTSEDTDLNDSVSASDIDLDTLTYSKVADPAHGTVTVNADGTFTYTPVADYNGPDSFTFKANDGFVDSNTATFTITVTAVNDAPTISDIANQTIDEDGATSALAFTVGDVETAAGSLTVTGSSSNTTLVPNANIVFGGSGANRTVTVTPAADQNGTATITVTVDDGSLSSNDTFLLTVTAVNDAPVATADSDSTPEDTPLNGQLAGTDVEGDTLTFAKVADPSNGSVVVNADGTFAYTPDLNFNGSDSFTFKANDGTADSAPATFSITVTPVNDAPTISNILDLSTDEDETTGAIGFTVSDAETAVASLTVTATSSDQGVVADGDILLGGSGASRTITVTPVADESGSATITVTVSDGTDEGTDTFVLTVDPVNDPPTIEDIDLQTIIENEELTDLSFTVGDPDGDSVTVTGSSDNQTLVADANIVVTGVGTTRLVTVTPTPGENGTVTITLTVDDGNGGTASDDFVLTVDPDAQPIAVDDSASILGLLTTDVTVLANDTGLENGPVTVTIAPGTLDPVLEGSVTIGADGVIHFTPTGISTNFTFDYVVTDADGDSDTGTVTITLL